MVHASVDWCHITYPKLCMYVSYSSTCYGTINTALLSLLQGLVIDHSHQTHPRSNLEIKVIPESNVTCSELLFIKYVADTRPTSVGQQKALLQKFEAFKRDYEAGQEELSKIINTFSSRQRWVYRQVSNTKRTLVGYKIVDHSDVVGASPVGAAPTTSSFSTWHLASLD